MRRPLSGLMAFLLVSGGVEALENLAPLKPSPAARRAADIGETNAAFAAWTNPASPGCALGILKDGKMLFSPACLHRPVRSWRRPLPARLFERSGSCMCVACPDSFFDLAAASQREVCEPKPVLP